MKRYTPRSMEGEKGFTLLELLTVMAIIIVLAGMILAGVGFAQQKAARERATAEIAALSVAIESYKIDNGEYPRSNSSDALDPTTASSAGPPSGAALDLFQKLHQGRYFEFKADMVTLSGTATTISADGGNVTALIDPFGNTYGYSTRYIAGETTKYYNPTFDLWSTGGTPGDPAKWITNW